MNIHFHAVHQESRGLLLLQHDILHGCNFIDWDIHSKALSAETDVVQRGGQVDIELLGVDTLLDAAASGARGSIGGVVGSFDTWSRRAGVHGAAQEAQQSAFLEVGPVMEEDVSVARDLARALSGTGRRVDVRVGAGEASAGRHDDRSLWWCTRVDLLENKFLLS